MIAKEMFSNAISFENAKNVRVNEYNEMLKIQNNIVINKLPKIIDDCRINNSYHYKNLIRVHKYNDQLAETLGKMGFTVLRPNPLPGAFNWHPDMDDDLYIRDEELYALQQESKKQQKCNIM